MEESSLYRVGIVVLLLVNVVYLGSSYASAETGAGEIMRESAEPRGDITVITTQHFARTIRTSEIVAYGPDGALLYRDDSYLSYFDVDPVPGKSASVVYVATDRLNSTECDGSGCNRIILEQLNVTTGERRVIYEFAATGRHHDVDRIDDDRYAVADIARDRVYVLDTDTGLVEWGWAVQHDYSPAGGGPYPSDWTHINDVEVLADGRLMASVRNQDQVVFLNRTSGLVTEWTLGCEDCHDTLYEQHNPDYINRRHGGPAVVVADSENNRVIEYQRRNGSWVQTWMWADEHLDWPRDGDRLPNGNTLITDSRGDRVLEVAPNGTIVWSVDIGLPYEAERLGTGDESSGGPAASRAGLASRSDARSTDVDSASAGFREAFKSLFPREVEKALIFVLPTWVHFYELLSLLFSLSLITGWTALELYWSPYTVRVVNPIVRSK